MVATSAACAATMTGDITAMTRHTLTLENGSTMFVPNSDTLKALRLGEKVTVAYEATNGDGEKQANEITPMNANLGG
jgi:hypothetical protein